MVFFSECFSGCFDTSGSMIPRLVPEILPCDNFCDGWTRTRSRMWVSSEFDDSWLFEILVKLNVSIEKVQPPIDISLSHLLEP